MPVRRLLPLLAATAALLVLAPGCGGDPPVTIANRTLHVRLDEYRIMPQNVKVQAGRLRIVATNVGRLTHNLKVVKQDESDLEAPPEQIGGTRSMQPGESASYTFEDLPAGQYRMACTIANHDDLGQYGTLTVVNGKG